MIINMRCKVKTKMKIRFNLSIKNSVNSESATIMTIKMNMKINNRIVQNKINMMKMKMILNNSSKTKITKSKVMSS
jgi:hypothetical protein